MMPRILKHRENLASFRLEIKIRDALECHGNQTGGDWIHQTIDKTGKETDTGTWDATDPALSYSKSSQLVGR